MARVDKFVFFLTLQENLSASITKYDVSCGLVIHGQAESSYMDLLYTDKLLC